MFHVSYQTVLYRLVEDGIADARIWPSFHTMYRMKTGRSLAGGREPQGLSSDVFLGSVEAGVEEPKKLTASDFVPDRRAALVRDALEKQLISLSRAAELLHVDLGTMRQIAAGWTL